MIITFICFGCSKEYTLERTENREIYFCSKKCYFDNQKILYTIKSLKSFEERFWSKVDKTPGLGPSGDCWEWIGNIGKNGYGNLSVCNKKQYAHRLSYELHNKKIDDPKLFVCHTCDNRKCVNPDHLWLGTANDNNQDMKKKSRYNNINGENHPKAKLNKEQIKTIREQYKNEGKSLSYLSRIFKVQHTTISAIVHYRTWKTV